MKTFLRRLEILNYLKSQHTEISTEKIIQHLSETAYIDTQESKLKSQFRLIQRDLSFLLGDEVKAETAEGEMADHEDNDAQIKTFDNDFGLSRKKGLGKSRLWRLDPYQHLSYSFEKMPAFMALALSVSQKHLKQVLPSETQQELKRIFQHAEEKLRKKDQKLSTKHYQRLSQAVEFFQRGQQLKAAEYDVEILSSIYRAILEGKRIKISYSNRNQVKDYDLHPYGVAIMLPKLYLIAKKNSDITKGEEAFRSFLIHKVSEIEISPLANRVPDSFHLKTYLDEGHMDVLLEMKDSTRYSLKLEISVQPFSNLLSDLKESPISAKQILTQKSDSSWILEAEVRRTIQLKNWLLSLGSQARIISPSIIRNDLTTALDAMRSQY